MKNSKCVPVLTGLCALLFLPPAARFVCADEGHGEAAKSHGAEAAGVQTMCPVLPGNKINPKVYVDYKGKRVYFCCEDCKAEFEHAPEKYLSRLPQFAEPRHAEHEHDGHGFHPGALVKPFGIATFVLMVLTAGSGLLMARNRKLLFKWHRRAAFSTVAVAICHVSLVLFFH